MVDSALTAQEELSNKGIDVSVTNARFVKPLDLESLDRIAAQAKVIVTIEEGQVAGGFGQKVAAHLMSTGFGGKFMAMGIPDHFVTHGHRSILLRELGLDTKGIVRTVVDIESGKHAWNGHFFSKLRFRWSEHSKPIEGAASADLFTGKE
jgi:1-deoxy-D-xylulose-5-phosphate synthase